MGDGFKFIGKRIILSDQIPVPQRSHKMHRRTKICFLSSIYRPSIIIGEIFKAGEAGITGVMNIVYSFQAPGSKCYGKFFKIKFYNVLQV